MAEAALVRSWEVFALCQGAAQPEDLTPATVQSFSHLLEKIQRNPDKMAQVQVAQPQVHVVNAHHQRQLQQQHHQRLLQQQQQQMQLQQLQQLRQQQQQQLQQQQAQRQAVGPQAYTAQMAQPQVPLQVQGGVRPQGGQPPLPQGAAPIYSSQHWPGGYLPAAAAGGLSQAPGSSQHAGHLQQAQAQQRQQLPQHQQQQQQQLLHSSAASMLGLTQQQRQQLQQSAAASMPALTQQQKFIPPSNPGSVLGLSQQQQSQQKLPQNSAAGFHALPQQQQLNQQEPQQLLQSVAGNMQGLIPSQTQQVNTQTQQQQQQPVCGSQSNPTATPAQSPQQMTIAQ